MATELRVFLKDGPKRQIPTPQYDRTAAHLALLREGSDKASEGLNPYKVKPRPGIVWGRIIDAYLPTTLVRPDTAKASVRHWIETPDKRRFIFEYARGQLIRTNDGEWLAVEEKHLLAEEHEDLTLTMLNKSILVSVDPLPTHRGALYDPSARQVQAEIGSALNNDCPELGLELGDRVAFIATAGTYCIIGGIEYRIIHRDQVLGILL